ncbi:MAG: hypothetical protein KBE65_19495 [Phycisphaerae bacterium]|nr:hypothetical protein [Phycisphaerae bacterium]
MAPRIESAGRKSAVVESLGRRLEGWQDREKPQLQALRSHGSIEDHLAEYSRRLGLGKREYAELLHPTRHVERPERDTLMYLLWRQGRVRLGQIAGHFGVGESAVSHACRRVEARLKTDRKLRSTLQTITE